MKKNSQIHVYLETQFKEKLIREANEEGISFSELCRQKLNENSQLKKIEFILGQIKESVVCREE